VRRPERTRFPQAIAAEQGNLDRASAYIQELRDTRGLLRTLPERLNYDVIVPFGKVAMFTGAGRRARASAATGLTFRRSTPRKAAWDYQFS